MTIEQERCKRGEDYDGDPIPEHLWVENLRTIR